MAKKNAPSKKLQQLQAWVMQQQFAHAEHWLQQQTEKLDDEAMCIEYFIQYSIFLSEQNHHSQAMEILQEALKYFENNVALLSQLAELSQVQGQILPAVLFLKQALTHNENNTQLWVQLSSVCLSYFPEEARKAAVKSCELSRELITDEDHSMLLIAFIQNQAKNALAMVESHDQNYVLAETLFDEILNIFPNFVPALQGLGQQKLQQGAIDDAVNLFEKVKTVDWVNGHLSLIRARRFPDNDEILKKLEKTAQSPSLEGTVKTGILFQLISVWEKRQNFSKAFTFAIEANNASQHFLSYDPKVHRQQSARIRSSFCKALYEHRQGYGIDSTIPVYIVGMPRSGTTLVEQILSGHSQIFGAGELNLIPNIIQGLERWERHVGSGRSYPDCVDDLTQSVTQRLANNVLQQLQTYAPKARYIIDKLPHNFENIGLIKFLFPQAKIISVRRDPRDIAISNYFTDYQAKHGGMGFAYDLTHIGEQLADHNQMMQHWHQVFPNQILEIHYESLIDRLETSSRELLRYLGIDWEADVLLFNQLQRPIKTASVWQVRQPVYKSSKARWKHYQKFLAPLIQGTNTPIEVDPIEMMSLPEAGFLTKGVAFFHQQKLNEAEMCFQKMLHHNPHHAACLYMLGLVYLHKGYLSDGIEKIEIALQKVPWQHEWQQTLIKAYQNAGMNQKANELQKNKPVLDTEST